MYMKNLFIAKATIQTKLEWKAFARTLLPFYVALLAIVKNDLIIAW